MASDIDRQHHQHVFDLLVLAHCKLHGQPEHGRKDQHGLALPHH